MDAARVVTAQSKVTIQVWLVWGAMRVAPNHAIPMAVDPANKMAAQTKFLPSGVSNSVSLWNRSAVIHVAIPVASATTYSSGVA